LPVEDAAMTMLTPAIPVPKVEERPMSKLEGLRVLIADDEEKLRRTLVRGLSRSGAAILEAGEGEQVLAMLGAQPVDILLLDGWMPNGDGVHVLRHLGARPPELRPLVLMLTGGDPIAADGRTFREHGADGVIQKPIRLNELADRLAQAFALSGRTPVDGAR
jgi:CheY-like chemotaxis protein